MGLAADLVNYIDAASTLVSATTTYPNLFKHTLPESTRPYVVAVIETAGSLNVEKFSGRLPALVRPRAQISVRGSTAIGGDGIDNSSAARNLAGDIWDILVGVHDETVNGHYVQRIEVLQTPFLLRRDERGRAVFGFNCEATMSPTTQA